jgi:hypothetical protein
MIGRADRKRLEQQGRLGEDRLGSSQFPEGGGGPDAVVRRPDPSLDDDVREAARGAQGRGSPSAGGRAMPAPRGQYWEDWKNLPVSQMWSP